MTEHAALDLEDLAGQLNAWVAPEPTVADADRLVRALRPLVASRPANEQALVARRSTWSDLVGLLELARLQVSVIRPAFWLASASIVLIGLLLVAGRASAERTLFVYLVGPVLGYLGTASAFRDTRLGLLEVELACPPSARQLTVARLTVILTYLVALGFAASLVLSVGAGEPDGFWQMTLHWLAPLLLGVGATLVLSLRLSVLHAASVVYAIWLAVVWWAWQTSLGGAALTLEPFVELLLCAAGVGLTLLAVQLLPGVVVRTTGEAPR